MARGKKGFYLEAWKFGVYLGLPLLASWYYNDPSRQKAAADYWKFVQYPANPNTNLKEQIEALRETEEARKLYRQQLKQLQTAANQTTETSRISQEKSGKWWNWFARSNERKQS